jgi:hypothetical protein
VVDRLELSRSVRPATTLFRPDAFRLGVARVGGAGDALVGAGLGWGFGAVAGLGIAARGCGRGWGCGWGPATCWISGGAGMAGTGGPSSGPANGAGSTAVGVGEVLSRPASSTNETSIGSLLGAGKRVVARP